MGKKILILLQVTCLILITNSLVMGQNTIKLKAANYLPTTHPMSLLTQWFCDEIKKRTDGRVEIAYYPGGTLLSPVKMYVGVTTGIADMGFSHIGYTRGRFPVTEVGDLPLGYNSGYVAAQVSNDFYNEFKAKEWDKVHPLYFATSPPLVIHTNNKPVKTMEELAGLKIRATGQMGEVIKALGAVPIPLQMPDVYEALKRGVIDGTTSDLSPLKFWKFAEVVKYTTASWQLGTTVTFYYVMSKRKWDNLSPDIQKIFTDVALEAQDKQAIIWNEMDIEGRDHFLKQGGQIFNLSESEAAKWKKAAEPVMAKYKEDMAAKGYNESTIDTWIKYIKERIEYWKVEEKKRGIATPYM